jgi:hypothetical protein
MSIRRMLGVDSHGAAAPATTIAFDFDEESYVWFNERPQSETTHIRLLCAQLDTLSPPDSLASTFKVPLPQSVVEYAVWKPEVYHNLACNPSGGAAGLTDEPWRFILQTPIDGGPFCSFALSRKANVVKGIYFFDDQILDPFKIAEGDSSPSTWRSSGLQIVTLPHRFLQAHSAEFSRRLASTIAKVRGVEKELAVAELSEIDVRSLSRTLHSCSLELVDIERRSRFEERVVDAIETIIAASNHAKLPWPPLSPQRTALASRQFDFESLPRRIENARATISGLIQQRNEALNLELTQASHAIAEATLNDSRSMKTIAILTMVLLPGTAVASLFSMNMFDWSASDGGNIASKWLWIYFAVTIPLTGIILVLWWFWNRQSLRSAAAAASTSLTGNTPDAFRDEEAGVDSVETADVDPDGSK